MSEKHLYEKHLAEKLQQLSPPPDMEQHWQEMKAMLDDDRPRGGGYGKRWWRIGVIAGLLLIGGWITGTFVWNNEPGKLLVDRPNSANVENKKLSPGQTASETEKGMASNGKGNTPAADKGRPDLSAAGDNTGGADKTVGGRNRAQAPGTVSKGLPDTESSRKDGLARNNEAVNRRVREGGAATDKNSVAANDKANSFSETSRSLSRETNTDNKVANKPLAKQVETLAGTRGPGIKNRGKTQYSSDAGIDDKITQSNSTKDETAKNNTNKKPIEYSPLHENISYNESISLTHPENLKADFGSVKATEKLKSKSARAGKSGRAGTFSFGFSLPLAFPLGDQKALSYNFNAGANTVSDYIPSPHVQYRLNDKTYLQTELQFIAPQYIRPILLYENRMQASGYMVYNSIYARKLYYFNLPVGIHHSPFQNFYLGTGLQFSSLLSGVGLYEETKRTMSGQPVSLLSEHYGRLSGDSLSQRMNRGEVRLMLEANYYFNRFTFGLRYNQAFNNYVNFRIDNMSPYTFDKNKALQFYLRYNLWEDVRRKNNSKGMLSSK